MTAILADRIPQAIVLEGVRVHNLQSISLELPLRKLTVITGVSGSGKSSLAFDTLFAEGQRRYIEGFSTYARQFLDRLEKPDADRIDHIPPAIAVRQRAAGESKSGGGKSTVATATDIHDYLRLLYARMGEIVCPDCEQIVAIDSPEEAAQRIAKFTDGTRFQIGFPVTLSTGETDAWAPLRQAGFTRAIAGGRTIDLRSDSEAALRADVVAWVIVDRLRAGSAADERIADSLETAFREGDDRCVVLAEAEGSESPHEPPRTTIDGRLWTVHPFNRRLECAGCGRLFPEPEPRLFSFNSPLGACPECSGFGSVPAISAERLVSDPAETPREEAIVPGKTLEPCAACGGLRLQPAALAVRIGGLNIAELCGLPLDIVNEFFDRLDALSPAVDQRTTATITAEARARVRYLEEAGLGYLTLDRPLRTLSGGEARRVALTAALGSSLVNTLYVLDEPSAGLHPRDNERVIAAIGRLRDAGNTVVVVEHDAAFLDAADELIDIGPGAGGDGGRLVFQGAPSGIVAVEESVTGAFASGRRAIALPAPESRRKPSQKPGSAACIRLTGVRHRNLRDVTVEFPLGLLCVVAGVSGSGKSSLVHETLYPALCRQLGRPCSVAEAGEYAAIEGVGGIDEVVLVDPSPVSRTRRSNPVTYLKTFDDVRTLFSQTREARARNYTASTFSFNSARGGRCPKCRGSGAIEVDMQFLADISMTCGDCHGRRYRQDVLDVKYRGRSIADVLDMTVREAFTFFRTQPRLLRRLNFLNEVGLDYLPLGQPTTTLSGGELQRLKLAAFLAAGSKSRTLFLIDEPTAGLHAADVERLLGCFAGLLAVGHSLIVIEHHLDVIKSADYVVDLGPEAGPAGGRVVAAGTPEAIAANEESITGRYLRTVGVPSSGEREA